MYTNNLDNVIICIYLVLIWTHSRCNRCIIDLEKKVIIIIINSLIVRCLISVQWEGEISMYANNLDNVIICIYFVLIWSPSRCNICIIGLEKKVIIIIYRLIVMCYLISVKWGKISMCSKSTLILKCRS